MTDEDNRQNGQHNSQPAGQDGPMMDIAGIAGGVVWLVAILWWWLGQPDGQGPGVAMALLLVVVPLGLLAALISSLRTVRGMRAEAARLHGALDAARNGAGPRDVTRPSALAMPAPAMADPVRAPSRPAEQTSLAFDDAPDGPDLTIEDYILALNFPDSPDDEDGIEALQMVLTDHEAARLIRSAQDVLTLLAQDGVFMDDLTPEQPRADLWRRFAAGERGPSTRGVGAVHDRSALTMTTARLREDQIFRDAAHHFMRSFDRSLPAFGEYATDGELAALADTRTSRAFMLVARASGAFD